MIKLCTYCKNNKNIFEFGIKKRKTRKNEIKEYVSIYCKSCEAIKSKLWRKSNPDKEKENNCGLKAKIRKNKWLKNNKQKRKEHEKQYYINNIEKFKKYFKTSNFKEIKRKYKNNRRKSDPIFKIKENISNSILKALKRGKSNKVGQSILKYLNYSIQNLKNHLEKQFDYNMSWNNYGVYWHIDHIVPHSDFKYLSMEDEQFKECWKLTNLRPLEAKQNMIDGATHIRHKKK